MASTIDGSLITVDSIAGNRLKPAAGITRSQLAQFPNAIRRITPFEWRVWNSGALLTTAGTDDLGLVAGTFNTDVFTVQAGDLKAAGATTRYALVQVALPENYEDGQTVTLRLTAGMETTAADGSCTLDVECYKVGDNAQVDGADLCTTAAQSINSTTPADKDFTITPSSLVAGDVLEIRIAITCTDTATVTAVSPTVYLAALLYDARG